MREVDWRWSSSHWIEPLYTGALFTDDARTHACWMRPAFGSLRLQLLAALCDSCTAYCWITGQPHHRSSKRTPHESQTRPYMSHKRQTTHQVTAHASNQDTKHALLQSPQHQGDINSQGKHGPHQGRSRNPPSIHKHAQTPQRRCKRAEGGPQVPGGSCVRLLRTSEVLIYTADQVTKVFLPLLSIPPHLCMHTQSPTHTPATGPSDTKKDLPIWKGQQKRKFLSPPHGSKSHTSSSLSQSVNSIFGRLAAILTAVGMHSTDPEHACTQRLPVRKHMRDAKNRASILARGFKE